MASDFYNEYESECNNAAGDARALIEEFRNTKDVDRRHECLKQLQRKVTQCEQTNRQMEMELRTLPSNVVNEHSLVERLADQRNVVRELRAEHDKAHYAVETLMLVGDIDGDTGQHRQLLVDATDRLQSGTARIEEAKRLAFETERIGVGIASELHSQREVIIRTKDNVSLVDAHLEAARSGISRIWRRSLQNRFVLYGVVSLIAVGLIYVIWRAVF